MELTGFGLVNVDTAVRIPARSDILCETLTSLTGLFVDRRLPESRDWFLNRKACLISEGGDR